MVLIEILYLILVQLVINQACRLQKLLTFEILTKVDFLRNFLNITFFEIFESHQ